jgi:hypothetical protein
MARKKTGEKKLSPRGKPRLTGRDITVVVTSESHDSALETLRKNAKRNGSWDRTRKIRFDT